MIDWRKIEDELPEVGQDVLVRGIDEWAVEDKSDIWSVGWTAAQNKKWLKDYAVTHWAPINWPDEAEEESE